MHSNGALRRLLFLALLAATAGTGNSSLQAQEGNRDASISGSERKAAPEQRGLVAPASAWQYVTPQTTDAFPAAPAVSVPLVETRPAVLERDVSKPDQAKRTYGLIRFGSAQSVQIAILVDDYGGGRFDLYVNADRDSEITPDELVAGTGNTRQTTLSCEVAYSEPLTPEASQPAKTASSTTPVPGVQSEQARTKKVKRVVVLKRGLVGRSLTLVTQGYLEGKVKLQDVEIPGRRMDGDGNGLFTDARDRLWLDLNRDGKWDSFTEQFAFQPLLTLAGQRYGVRTDRTGEGLWCEPITGEGHVRFAIAELAAGAFLKETEISVVGRDGSLFAARTVDEPVTLPVGDYALSLVRVTIGDKDDSARQWEFVFSKIGIDGASIWHTVKKDQNLVIDPIGKISLNFEWDGKGSSVPPGRELYLRPILTTQGGLVINSGRQFIGSVSQEICLSMQLCRPDLSRIDTASSGYA